MQVLAQQFLIISDPRTESDVLDFSAVETLRCGFRLFHPPPRAGSTSAYSLHAPLSTSQSLPSFPDPDTSSKLLSSFRMSDAFHRVSSDAAHPHLDQYRDSPSQSEVSNLDNDSLFDEQSSSVMRSSFPAKSDPENSKVLFHFHHFFSFEHGLEKSNLL